MLPGMAKKSRDTERITDLLRLKPGVAVDLSKHDSRATPGFDRGREAAEAMQAALAERLADLQERLWAEGRAGGTRSLLLVLQGMDTSGKGGTAKHVLGQVDPQGVTMAAFGVPTEEEKAHGFLWRFDRKLPRPGYIQVFDRSYYEDVLVVRVHELDARRTWSARYSRINRWEEKLVEAGTRVVKVYLHISPEESRKRLLARLDDDTKYWKYKPGDVDERAYWPEYQSAYEDALSRCGTADAPWHLVPADRKWYRNLAVTSLLVEELEAMNPQWPAPDFDLAAERERVLES